MVWNAQWRTKGGLDDAVFVVDDVGHVCRFLPASPLVLSRFLTDLTALESLDGESAAEGADPEAWGELVLARGRSGEVLEVEPELFWHGLYSWFRSRGVDFDSPDAAAIPRLEGAPVLPMSKLMDD
jgi:hypothetical protein